MKDQTKSETRLIAYCGLYCGNCKRFKNGKCPGCADYEKATWCKIRKCCIEKGITNCSACEEYVYPMDCSKYNTFLSRAIGFFTSTDRSLCIEFLRRNSPEEFVDMMQDIGKMSLPGKKKK